MEGDSNCVSTSDLESARKRLEYLLQFREELIKDELHVSEDPLAQKIISLFTLNTLTAQHLRKLLLKTNMDDRWESFVYYLYTFRRSLMINVFGEEYDQYDNYNLDLEIPQMIRHNDKLRNRTDLSHLVQMESPHGIPVPDQQMCRTILETEDIQKTHKFLEQLAGSLDVKDTIKVQPEMLTQSGNVSDNLSSLTKEETTISSMVYKDKSLVAIFAKNKLGGLRAEAWVYTHEHDVTPDDLIVDQKLSIQSWNMQEMKKAQMGTYGATLSESSYANNGPINQITLINLPESSKVSSKITLTDTAGNKLNEIINLYDPSSVKHMLAGNSTFTDVPIVKREIDLVRDRLYALMRSNKIRITRNITRSRRQVLRQRLLSKLELKHKKKQRLSRPEKQVRKAQEILSLKLRPLKYYIDSVTDVSAIEYLPGLPGDFLDHIPSQKRASSITLPTNNGKPGKAPEGPEDRSLSVTFGNESEIRFLPSGTPDMTMNGGSYSFFSSLLPFTPANKTDLTAVSGESMTSNNNGESSEKAEHMNPVLNNYAVLVRDRLRVIQANKVSLPDHDHSLLNELSHNNTETVAMKESKRDQMFDGKYYRRFVKFHMNLYDAIQIVQQPKEQNKNEMEEYRKSILEPFKETKKWEIKYTDFSKPDFKDREHHRLRIKYQRFVANLQDTLNKMSAEERNEYHHRMNTIKEHMKEVQKQKEMLNSQASFVSRHWNKVIPVSMYDYIEYVYYYALLGVNPWKQTELTISDPYSDILYVKPPGYSDLSETAGSNVIIEELDNVTDFMPVYHVPTDHQVPKEQMLQQCGKRIRPRKHPKSGIIRVSNDQLPPIPTVHETEFGTLRNNINELPTDDFDLASVTRMSAQDINRLDRGIEGLPPKKPDVTDIVDMNDSELDGMINNLISNQDATVYDTPYESKVATPITTQHVTHHVTHHVTQHASHNDTLDAIYEHDIEDTPVDSIYDNIDITPSNNHNQHVKKAIVPIEPLAQRKLVVPSKLKNVILNRHEFEAPQNDFGFILVDEVLLDTFVQAIQGEIQVEPVMEQVNVPTPATMSHNHDDDEYDTPSDSHETMTVARVPLFHNWSEITSLFDHYAIAGSNLQETCGAITSNIPKQTSTGIEDINKCPYATTHTLLNEGRDDDIAKKQFWTICGTYEYSLASIQQGEHDCYWCRPQTMDSITCGDSHSHSEHDEPHKKPLALLPKNQVYRRVRYGVKHPVYKSLYLPNNVMELLRKVVDFRTLEINLKKGFKTFEQNINKGMYAIEYRPIAETVKTIRKIRDEFLDDLQQSDDHRNASRYCLFKCFVNLTEHKNESLHISWADLFYDYIYLHPVFDIQAFKEHEGKFVHDKTLKRSVRILSHNEIKPIISQFSMIQLLDKKHIDNLEYILNHIMTPDGKFNNFESIQEQLFEIILCLADLNKLDQREYQKMVTQELNSLSANPDRDGLYFPRKSPFNQPFVFRVQEGTFLTNWFRFYEMYFASFRALHWTLDLLWRLLQQNNLPLSKASLQRIVQDQGLRNNVNQTKDANGMIVEKNIDPNQPKSIKDFVKLLFVPDLSSMGLSAGNTNVPNGNTNKHTGNAHRSTVNNVNQQAWNNANQDVTKKRSSSVSKVQTIQRTTTTTTTTPKVTQSVQFVKGPATGDDKRVRQVVTTTTTQQSLTDKNRKPRHRVTKHQSNQSTVSTSSHVSTGSTSSRTSNVSNTSNVPTVSTGEYTILPCIKDDILMDLMYASQAYQHKLPVPLYDGYLDYRKIGTPKQLALSHIIPLCMGVNAFCYKEQRHMDIINTSYPVIERCCKDLCVVSDMGDYIKHMGAFIDDIPYTFQQYQEFQHEFHQKDAEILARIAGSKQGSDSGIPNVVCFNGQQHLYQQLSTKQKEIIDHIQSWQDKVFTRYAETRMKVAVYGNNESMDNLKDSNKLSPKSAMLTLKKHYINDYIKDMQEFNKTIHTSAGSYEKHNNPIMHKILCGYMIPTTTVDILIYGMELPTSNINMSESMCAGNLNQGVSNDVRSKVFLPAPIVVPNRTPGLLQHVQQIIKSNGNIKYSEFTPEEISFITKPITLARNDESISIVKEDGSFNWEFNGSSLAKRPFKLDKDPFANPARNYKQPRKDYDNEHALYDLFYDTLDANQPYSILMTRIYDVYCSVYFRRENTFFDSKYVKVTEPDTRKMQDLIEPLIVEYDNICVIQPYTKGRIPIINTQKLKGNTPKNISWTQHKILHLQVADADVDVTPLEMVNVNVIDKSNRRGVADILPVLGYQQKKLRTGVPAFELSHPSLKMSDTGGAVPVRPAAFVEDDKNIQPGMFAELDPVIDHWHRMDKSSPDIYRNTFLQTDKKIWYSKLASLTTLDGVLVNLKMDRLHLETYKTPSLSPVYNKASAAKIPQFGMTREAYIIDVTREFIENGKWQKFQLLPSIKEWVLPDIGNLTEMDSQYDHTIKYFPIAKKQHQDELSAYKRIQQWANICLMEAYTHQENGMKRKGGDIARDSRGNQLAITDGYNTVGNEQKLPLSQTRARIPVSHVTPVTPASLVTPVAPVASLPKSHSESQMPHVEEIDLAEFIVPMTSEDVVEEMNATLSDPFAAYLRHSYGNKDAQEEKQSLDATWKLLEQLTGSSKAYLEENTFYNSRPAYENESNQRVLKFIQLKTCLDNIVTLASNTHSVKNAMSVILSLNKEYHDVGLEIYHLKYTDAVNIHKHPIANKLRIFQRSPVTLTPYAGYVLSDLTVCHQRQGRGQPAFVSATIENLKTRLPQLLFNGQQYPFADTYIPCYASKEYADFITYDGRAQQYSLGYQGNDIKQVVEGRLPFYRKILESKQADHLLHRYIGIQKSYMKLVYQYGIPGRQNNLTWKTWINNFGPGVFSIDHAEDEVLNSLALYRPDPEHKAAEPSTLQKRLALNYFNPLGPRFELTPLTIEKDDHSVASLPVVPVESVESVEHKSTPKHHSPNQHAPNHYAPNQYMHRPVQNPTIIRGVPASRVMVKDHKAGACAVMEEITSGCDKYEAYDMNIWELDGMKTAGAYAFDTSETNTQQLQQHNQQVQIANDLAENERRAVELHDTKQKLESTQRELVMVKRKLFEELNNKNSNVADVQSKLHAKEHEIQQLQQQLHNLQQNQSKQGSLEAVERENAALKKQLQNSASMTQAEIQRLNKQISQIKEEANKVSLFENQNIDRATTIEEANQRLATQRQQLQEYLNSLESILNDKIGSKSQQMLYQETTDSKVKKQEEINKLNQQLKYFMNQYQSLQQASATKDTQLKQLENVIQTKTQEYTVVQTKLTAMMEEVTVYKSSLAQLQKDKQLLQQQIQQYVATKQKVDAMVQQKNQHIAALETENQQLKHQLQGLTQTIQTQQLTITGLQKVKADNETLKNTLEQTQQSLKDIQAKSKQDHEQQLEQLQQHKNALVQSNEKLQKLQAEKNQILLNLEQERALGQEHDQKHQQNSKRIQELTAQQQQLQKQIKEQQLQQQHLKDQVQSTQEQLKQLGFEKAEAEKKHVQEINDLSAKYQKSVVDLQKKQQELTNVTQSVQQQQSQLKQSQQQIQQLEAQKQAVLAKQQELQQKLSQSVSKDELVKAQAESQRLQQLSQQMKQSVSQKEQEVQKLQQNVQSMKQTIEQQKQQLREATIHATNEQKYLSQLTDAQKQLQENVQRNQALNQSIEQIKQQNQQLNNQLKQYQQDRAKMQQLNDALQAQKNENQQLKQKVADQQQQLQKVQQSYQQSQQQLQQSQQLAQQLTKKAEQLTNALNQQKQLTEQKTAELQRSKEQFAQLEQQLKLSSQKDKQQTEKINSLTALQQQLQQSIQSQKADYEKQRQQLVQQHQQNIQGMQLKISTHEQEMQKLRDAINAKDRLVQDTKKQVLDQQNTIGVLQKTNSAQAAKLLALDQQIKQEMEARRVQKTQLDALKNSLTKKEQENRALVLDLQQKSKQLELTVQDKQKSEQMAKMTQQQLAQKTSELEQVKREQQRLQQESQQRQQVISKMSQEQQQSAQKMQQLNQQLAQMNRNQADYDKLKDQANMMKQQMQQRDAMIDQLKQEQAKLNKQVQVSQSMQEQLKRDLSMEKQKNLQSQQKLADMDAQMKQYMQSLQQARSESQEKQKQLQQQGQMIDSIKSDLQKQKQQVVELAAKEQVNRRELQQHIQSEQKLQSEKSQLQQNLQQVQKLKEQRENEIQKLSNDIQQVNQQRQQDLRKAQMDVQKYQNQIADLQKQLQMKDQQIQSLQQQNQKLTQNVHSLETLRDKLQTENAQIKSTLAIKDKERLENLKKLQHSEQESQRLQTLLTVQQKSRQEAEEALKQERMMNKKRFEDQAKQADIITVNLKTEIQKLSQQTQIQQKQIIQFQQADKTQELEAAKVKLSQQQQQMQRLQDQMLQHQNESKQYQEKIQKLMQDQHLQESKSEGLRHQIQGLLTERDAMKKSNADLQNAQQEASRKLKQQQDQLMQAKHEADTLKQQQQQIQREKQEMLRKDQEIQSQLQKTMMELKREQSLHQDLKNNHQQVSVQLQQAKKLADQHQSMNQQTKEQLRTAIADTQKAHAETQRLQLSMSSQVKELQAQKAANTQLKGDLQHKDQQLQSANMEKEQLKQQLQKQQQMLDQITAERNSHQRDSNNFNALIKELQDKIRDLKGQVMQRDKIIETLKHDIATRDSRIRDLDSKYQDVNNKLHKQQMDYDAMKRRYDDMLHQVMQAAGIMGRPELNEVLIQLRSIHTTITQQKTEITRLTMSENQLKKQMHDIQQREHDMEAKLRKMRSYEEYYRMYIDRANNIERLQNQILHEAVPKWHQDSVKRASKDNVNAVIRELSKTSMPFMLNQDSKYMLNRLHSDDAPGQVALISSLFSRFLVDIQMYADKHHLKLADIAPSMVEKTSLQQITRAAGNQSLEIETPKDVKWLVRDGATVNVDSEGNVLLKLTGGQVMIPHTIEPKEYQCMTPIEKQLLSVADVIRNSLIN